MTAGLQIIGDEIHFEGEALAIMTTNGSASSRGRFCDLLEECDEHPPAEQRAEEEASVLYEVEQFMEKAGKGGLLRVADLARLIARLKEPS